MRKGRNADDARYRCCGSRLPGQGFPARARSLNQPVHFGGTLQHLDESQWHDLLAKAAAPKPDAKEKDGATTAGKK